MNSDRNKDIEEAKESLAGLKRMGKDKKDTKIEDIKIQNENPKEDFESTLEESKMLDNKSLDDKFFQR